MKKTLFKLLGCCLIVVMASCGGSDETTEERVTNESAALAEQERIEAEEQVVSERSQAYRKYPDSCKDVSHVAYCGDSCKAQIARCHIIAETTFAQMTDTFSQPGLGFSAAAVRKIITDAQANCQNHWIRVNGEHADPDGNTNSDITVQALPLKAGQKRAITPRRFTVAMFQGILAQPGVDSFVFYKAHKLDCATQGKNCDDYIIRVVTQNKPDTYYDISDIPPAGWDTDVFGQK